MDSRYPFVLRRLTLLEGHRVFLMYPMCTPRITQNRLKQPNCSSNFKKMLKDGSETRPNQTQNPEFKIKKTPSKFPNPKPRCPIAEHNPPSYNSFFDFFLFMIRQASCVQSSFKFSISSSLCYLFFLIFLLSIPGMLYFCCSIEFYAQLFSKIKERDYS